MKKTGIMTLSWQDSRNLAELKSKLPPYCVIKQRKDYAVVYFQVPEKLRPNDWDATIRLGRTDENSDRDIIKRGKQLYEDLKKVRINQDLKIETNRPPKESLAGVIRVYQRSEHWEVLRPATQKGYQHHLNTIWEWSRLSGHPHISKYTAKHLTTFLAKWKDKPRSRKFYKAILSILFEIAIEEGLLSHNIVKEIRLPKNSRKKTPIQIWEEENVRQFINKADELGFPNTATAVLIGYEMGPRMTDIIEFQEPRDYHNGNFRFRTSKTDRLIEVRASQLLQDRLAKRPKGQLLLTVDDATNKPWTFYSLNKKFRKVRSAAGMDDYVFRYLRNSAAIHAERADFTDAEFEALFGWPRERVRKMIRDFYGDRDQEVADRAVAKLENYRRNR